MNKPLISLVAALLVAITLPSAEARSKKQKWQPTPQQQHDFMCQESDLSTQKETLAQWIQYQKDCAVRPANLKRFQKVVAEYIQYHQRGKTSTTDDSTDYVLDRVISGLLERTYLSLYELERQEVFTNRASVGQMKKLVSVRHCRQNKHGLRSTFAQCYIHGNNIGVDFGSYDEKKVTAYENSLKKQGLWTD